jgi:hypothetical protein
MSWNNRKSDRVQFQRAFPANLMGVDGTWRRSCELQDVSSTGARLIIEGSTDVLQAKEFFWCCRRRGWRSGAANWFGWTVQPQASVSFNIRPIGTPHAPDGRQNFLALVIVGTATMQTSVSIIGELEEAGRNGSTAKRGGRADPQSFPIGY